MNRDLIFLSLLLSYQEGIHSGKQQVCILKVNDSELNELDLPKLVSIDIGWSSFSLTTELILSSTTDWYSSIYIPNLKSFVAGDYSFYKTPSLSFKSTLSTS